MSEPLLTITSRENAVQLSLTNEQVRMTLSESVTREFHDDVRSDPDVQAPGLAGRFARFITGAVEKLLSSAIEYAVADIESVTMRDGALVFTYVKRHRPSFEDITIVLDGATVPALATFAPADAQAFAERFAALKGQVGGALWSLHLSPPDEPQPGE